MARPPAIAAAAAASLVAVAGCGSGGSGRPVVRVALDFTPNAAHAPLYAAADHPMPHAPVRIEIRQPGSSSDSLKLLAAGRADIAVVDIHDLGLARERGDDIVGIGELVNRPLAAVIAGPRIARPRDLEGKRVGVTGLPSDNAVLKAVVERDGGDYSRVKRVTIGFTAVPSLVTGKVSAVTAFWNVEGVTLRRRGIRTHEFHLDQRGSRYPELVLATTRAKLRSERRRLEDAMSMIGDGVTFANSDPRPLIADVARAGQTDPALVRAEFKALRPAFLTGVQFPMHALRNWARFDVRYGILKRPPDLKAAFDELYSFP